MVDNENKQGQNKPASSGKMTLRRKSVSSTIKSENYKSRSKKTVSVEVKKKRSFSKQPATVATTTTAVMPPAPVASPAAPTVSSPLVNEKKQAQSAVNIKEPQIVDMRPRTRKESTKKTSASVPAAANKAAPSSDSAKAKGKKSSDKRHGGADKDRQARKSKLRLEGNKKRGRHQFNLTDDDTPIRQAKRARFDNVASRQEFSKPVEMQVLNVSIPETISVADLAKKMFAKPAELIRVLMKLGSMATINQVIDRDAATILVEEMGHKPVLLNDDAIEEALEKELEHSGEEVTRPPVVTIMGHVDHGKTTLLDYIRRTKVADCESGGITQNIGAYHVETEKGVITFLDTPGHEAFTAMRARGAKSTDIVVLVVAADDGVMPQTIEAIQHAKAAEVPIIVAVNKIDKPEADPDRIRNELTKYELVPEEWGGDVMFINISAKQGQYVDDLLDMILLHSEVLELKAVQNIPAKGVVIEARMEKGRGAVMTMLVQQGTLRKGDIALAGLQYGRVRAILNEVGKPVDTAGPSIPVEVLGLSGSPNAGDSVVVVQEERKAREVALFRQGKFREVRLAQKTSSLDSLFDDLKAGDIATLNVVLKANVQGSVEALTDSLQKLSTDEVQVKIIASGVGGITESDVHLALASNAVIVGFNVRADLTARRLIEKEGVDVHYHNIIYRVVDEIKQALTGMLKPDVKEEVVGIAEVRDVFRVAKIGAVAGCMVVEGAVKRGKPIRVLRNNVVIYDGELESLRRHKDDVNEVRYNMECGVGVKNYNDVKVGDLIEVYETVTLKRSL